MVLVVLVVVGVTYPYMLVSLTGLTLVGYASGLIRSLKRLNTIEVEYPNVVRAVEGESVEVQVGLRNNLIEIMRFTGVEAVHDGGIKITYYGFKKEVSSLRAVLHVSPRVGTHKITSPRLYFSVLGGLAKGVITLDLSIEVSVLPAFKTSYISYLMPGFRHMGTGPSRTRGGGTNILEVREYVPGDEFKKIDWKATARLSRLVVKEFEKEMRRDVVLVLVLSDKFFATEAKILEGLTHDVCRLASGLLINGLHVRLLVITERGFILSDKVTSVSRIGEILNALSRIEWPERPLATYSAFKVASWLILPVVISSCSTSCVVVSVVSFEDLSDVEAALRVWRRLKTLSHEAVFAVVSPALIALRHEEIALEDLTRMYPELETLVKLSKRVPNSIIAYDIHTALLEKILRLRESF
ncbi:MAG: DUF58 domain-containing protein [Zestosphaera sp.]